MSGVREKSPNLKKEIQNSKDFVEFRISCVRAGLLIRISPFMAQVAALRNATQKAHNIFPPVIAQNLITSYEMFLEPPPDPV
jgi:hypothetical protein